MSTPRFPLDEALYLPGATLPRVRELYARLFSGAALDIVCAIVGGESSFYLDAVGDTELVTDTAGPSVGSCQVRVHRAAAPGNVRHIDYCRDPAAQVEAAWTLSKGGTTFQPWSAYTQPDKNGEPRYMAYLGMNPVMGVNYHRADRWTIDGSPVVFVPHLEEGRRNPSVRRLQRRVIELGYAIPAGATGYWGPQTVVAVAALQRTWRGFKTVPQPAAYATGESVGPLQAAAIFRDTNVRVATA